MYGTFQCFHCLHDSVVWDSDFNAEDFGHDGEGVVHILHCTNCGAEIQYVIMEQEDEEEEEPSEQMTVFDYVDDYIPLEADLYEEV